MKIWPWDEENSKPYFVNEKGIEWWIDKSLTEHAHRNYNDIKGAKNLFVFILRTLEGKILSRVIIDKDTNEPIYENTSLEAIAVWLDMYKLKKSSK